jgi:UV DNA damage repair endonuclease
MKGIPREVAEHKLNIKSGSKPVKQRLRLFNDDKCKAIGEEILKLLSAGVQGSSVKSTTPSG